MKLLDALELVDDHGDRALLSGAGEVVEEVLPPRDGDRIAELSFDFC